jgi:hypothetical protein
MDSKELKKITEDEVIALLQKICKRGHRNFANMLKNEFNGATTIKDAIKYVRQQSANAK